MVSRCQGDKLTRGGKGRLGTHAGTDKKSARAGAEYNARRRPIQCAPAPNTTRAGMRSSLVSLAMRVCPGTARPSHIGSPLPCVSPIEIQQRLMKGTQPSSPLF